MDTSIPPQIEEMIQRLDQGDRPWGKFIARISFQGRPAEINVRNIESKSERVGQGIVLSSEEIEAMVNKFLQMGYGDTSIMEEELTKRKSRIAQNEDFFDEGE